MLINYFKKNFAVILIIAAVFFIFRSSFSRGFSQDDYKNLYLSQHLSQVTVAFNIFQKAEYSFYRPLSTQLYFFLGTKIFGTNVFGYHLVNFLIFSLNIILVFATCRTITKKYWTSFFATLFFAVNSTHFAELNSPAYVQELLLVCFSLLSINAFFAYLVKNKIIFLTATVVYFLLALMSKETAIILPGTLLLVTHIFQKIKFRKMFLIMLLFAILGLVYLVGHFFFYGMPESASYKFSLGKANFLIVVWYFLWSFSTPNIFIDFLQPGLKINPVFWDVAGVNGKIMLILLPIMIINFAVIVISLVKKHTQIIFFGLTWFLIGIFPLTLFPLHKLAVEQAFAMIGLAMIFGLAITQGKKLGKVLLFTYLIFAVNSIILANRTHWIVRSEIVAQNTINYLEKHHPKIKDNTIFYFVNGKVKIATYGSSRQIFQALGEGRALEIIYHRPVSVFFEDIIPLSAKAAKEKKAIIIDSSKLLGY